MMYSQRLRRRGGRKVKRSRRRYRTYSRRGPWLLSDWLILALAALLVAILLWLALEPREEGGRYAVVGQPSVSADFIDQVLSAYGSPAAGKGKALYADGLAYRIDPVYALAFFLEESRFGTAGVARVTHSLGNIRALAGQASYAGYRRYATWEEGFTDWYRLIAEEYVARGLVTVDQIVPVYAPAADGNDVAAYVRTVKLAVDSWRAGKVLV
ncbi:glucosaminidase domain-containing protein [Thermogemmatispora sp.]|uniref:glucosaminidase domain-containing protein n=1 Tax=Thermogemmatispora sp. TaxID=1968838 RepID=UPI0035E40E08